MRIYWEVLHHNTTEHICCYCYWNQQICLFFILLTRMVLTPKPIDGLTGKKIVKIFCGSAHSAAITEQGELYTWGKGSRKLLGKPTSAIIMLY